MSRRPADRRPPRASRKWTPEDEERLRTLAAAGLEARAIARELRRTIIAVKDRAKKLKVPIVRNSHRPIERKRKKKHHR